MSLLLTGGTVLVSLDPAVVVTGSVEIEAGRIVRVGSSRPATPSPSAPTVRDCSGCLIVPGNVCAHTHLYSALARGMPNRLAPPRNFLEVLQRVWWRLDRALDERTIRLSALVGGAEALLAGTTTLFDHHASPNAIDGSLDVVADALAEVGIRAMLCYETSDRDGPERSREGIRENARFAARARHGAYPLARAMVGAHASFTLSDATLEACVAAAAEARTGIHVHVAEDGVDERDALERFGMRVVDRLDRAGALTDRALLAHCVHLDAVEATRVREARPLVAHNPRSNMNNAVGRAPLAQLEPHVALGTDGIGADMFEESRVAAFRHREDGVAFAGSWPLARLNEGARFAGRVFEEPAFGRIEPGAPADVAVLEYDAPAPMTEDSVAGQWVFGLSARVVRDVIVAGELVVADRTLTKIDQAALAAEARVEAARLWRCADEMPAHPFEPPCAAGGA